MCKYILASLAALYVCVFSQQYPSCLEGAPVDTGNTTDTYMIYLLELTSFLDISDTRDLTSAFATFARTGSSSQVDFILQANQQLYIIITVILSCVSLVLFVVMARMGNLHLTTKQVFERIKDKGFTSPISAFYILIAVILAASACANAYQIPGMIKSLRLTECRMDILKESFLNGVVGYDWGGLGGFADKLTILANLSASLEGVVLANETDQSQPLVYAERYLDVLNLQYAGIVNSYSTAVIGNTHNSSQMMALSDLIPNLFSNTTSNQTQIIFAPLQNYLELLDDSLTQLETLQSILNCSSSAWGSQAFILNMTAANLRGYIQDFTYDYANFRLSIEYFFSSGRNILIVCQLITAITIFGCLIAVVSLKLIQTKYDYFSLSMYKIIWATHIVVFCLNLIFLLMFNQILLYNTGVCTLADQLMANQTMVKSTFPKTQGNSGVYYLSGCFFATDFKKITHTDHVTGPLLQLVSIKQSLSSRYTKPNIGLYSPIFKSVEDALRPYQLGVKGVFSAMDESLGSINQVTNSNWNNEGCYRHHWQYSPSRCLKSEVGIVKPTSVAFLNNTHTYSSQKSMCYILSDYTSLNPTALDANTFYLLYGKYNGKCPQSNTAIAGPSQLFFSLLNSRTSVVGGLIDSVANLSSVIKNATGYLISYLNARVPFVSSAFVNVSGASYDSLSAGNDCGVVQEMIYGVYNQFCVTLRGSTHQVYLLVVCNIVYVIIMIGFSLLYAIELRSLGRKDLEQSYEQMRFGRTGNLMSSESSSELEMSEAKESKRSADEG